MKKLYLLISFIFITSFSYAQAPFIMTYEIPNASVTITTPVMNDPDNNYTINFGDGVILSNQTTTQATHTYINPGTYTITISGNYKRIYFSDYNGFLLKTVEQWGDTQWSNMQMMFYNCTNLTLNATDTPDLSNVTDMSYMFYGCSSLNQSINNWDVSNVTDMSLLFYGATLFNQPLNNWDVSNVTSMTNMFNNATAFNQSLNDWDVSSVEALSWMFYGATSFNQPLNNWNISNVTLMDAMFQDATSFNQPLNDWDVSNVGHAQNLFSGATSFNQPLNNWEWHSVSMNSMFLGATSFNQPLNDWNISEIDQLSSLFAGATSFNQPLSSWDVSNVTTMDSMFEGATSFNQPLDNWDMSNVLYIGYMFKNATSFNQPLDAWNLSSIYYTVGLFWGATSFNQPLNSWNLSSCHNTSFMFQDATLFNQPLNNWNVSNITSMHGMFKGATAFNQNISNWDFNNNISFGSPFDGAINSFLANCGMDSNNYDAFLLKISQSEITNKRLGAAGMEYCDQGVHDYLTNDLEWLIYNDSLGEGCGNNTFLGTVTYDENANGCDAEDMKAVNFLVAANNGSFNYATSTNTDGEYNINVLEGTFAVSVLNVPDYYTVTPQDFNTTFTGFGNEEAINFCLSANQVINDLNITLLPVTDARPGFESMYQLVANNMGTQTITNATVSLNYDGAKQSFVTATPAQASATAGLLTFNIPALQPFESTVIDFTLQTFTPPTVNGDDIAAFTATITPDANDYTQADNTFELNQIVVNSFDPNDKQILQGEEITMDQAEGYLDYMVRFQNTGTASAINVRIVDNLDPKLDWTTLTPVSASHNYTLQITESNQVEFTFNNINLPFEAEDEQGSNGFIAYKIKPLQTVQVGDIITGNAGIYFDFNAPIITNVATTQIIEVLGLKDTTLNNKITVYPNPASNVVNLQAQAGVEVQAVTLFNLQGRELLSYQGQQTIDVQSLTAGVYVLVIKTNKGTIKQKLAKK